MAKLSHEVEYLLARAGIGLVTSMSARRADVFAAGLGRLVNRVWRNRREVALGNIRRSDLGGAMTDEEQLLLVRTVFENMARSLIELVRAEKVGKEGLRDIVVGEGLEYVEQARKRGNGGIICTAHFGNWEYQGAWYPAMGHPMRYLVTVQKNPKIDALVTRFREAFGAGVIPNNVAARGILKALRANELVGIAADQHSHSGLEMPFLGRTARVHRGPALFAVKSGAPLLPVLLRRERYDRHVVMAGKPIYPPNSGDEEKDVDEMTRTLHRFYEERIRKYPDQWMWTHRRWKVREKESNFAADKAVKDN